MQYKFLIYIFYSYSAPIGNPLEQEIINRGFIVKWFSDIEDGKSSKRIIGTSISYLQKDKSHLKSKPLNLIRKYKKRKHINYFAFKSYNSLFTIK